MNDEKREREFLAAVKSSLRHSEKNIDELTQARLRAARHRAVAAHQEKTFWPVSGILTVDWLRSRRVALSAAMSLTIVGALLLLFNLQQPAQRLTPMLEDIELLTSNDDIELYQDLDFYVWIEDEQISG